jgi:hypothetical protein
MIMAFITKLKNPKVKTIRGTDKSVNKGLTKQESKLMITEAKTASKKLSTEAVFDI